MIHYKRTTNVNSNFFRLIKYICILIYNEKQRGVRYFWEQNSENSTTYKRHKEKFNQTLKEEMITNINETETFHTSQRQLILHNLQGKKFSRLFV